MIGTQLLLHAVSKPTALAKSGAEEAFEAVLRDFVRSFLVDVTLVVLEQCISVTYLRELRGLR